jgi:hypothetical protein
MKAERDISRTLVIFGVGIDKRREEKEKTCLWYSIVLVPISKSTLSLLLLLL